jgi:hypothetical protein
LHHHLIEVFAIEFRFSSKKEGGEPFMVKDTLRDRNNRIEEAEY